MRFSYVLAAMTTSMALLSMSDAGATSVAQCPPITFEEGWAKKIYDAKYTIAIAKPVSSRPVYHHDRISKYSYEKGNEQNSNREGKEPSFHLWEYDVIQHIKGDNSATLYVRNHDKAFDLADKANQVEKLIILIRYDTQFPDGYAPLGVPTYLSQACLDPLMTPLGKGTPAQQFLDALQKQLKTTQE